MACCRFNPKAEISLMGLGRNKGTCEHTYMNIKLYVSICGVEVVPRETKARALSLVQHSRFHNREHSLFSLWWRFKNLYR